MTESSHTPVDVDHSTNRLTSEDDSFENGRNKKLKIMLLCHAEDQFLMDAQSLFGMKPNLD